MHEDLGGRDRNSNDGSSYAAKAASICDANPDHRLNWVSDPTSTTEQKLIPAPGGHCAELTKCLDATELDPAVASRAISCLESDVDKDKPSACNEAMILNASATRPAVTDVENALAQKKAECPKLSGNGLTVLSDALLKEALRCFEKPSCDNVNDCLRGFPRLDDCLSWIF